MREIINKVRRILVRLEDDLNWWGRGGGRVLDVVEVVDEYEDCREASLLSWVMNCGNFLMGCVEVYDFDNLEVFMNIFITNEPRSICNNS